MPEYLSKIYNFFKTNNTARDVSIGAAAFVIGGYLLQKIKNLTETEE